MSNNIKEEIENARLALGLAESQIRLLPAKEGLAAFQAIETHFVASPHRRWWWEDFREASTHLHFHDGEGWKHLSDIVPSADEQVWFVAEDSTLPFYPVYEARVSIIQQVIGQCYAFEYYLTPKNFAWLLGENHSDVVFAVGEPVATNLQNLAVRNGRTS